MADVVTGQSCVAVTATWSQTCLQALALGQLGLLDLCERCTETVIQTLRWSLARRASSPAPVRQFASSPAGAGSADPPVAGESTPVSASSPVRQPLVSRQRGGRQVSPATGGLVTSTDTVRQPDNLADNRAGTPAAGGRLTLLRQPPAPVAGARRSPVRQRQSPAAGASLDAEMLARAHQLIAASEATPGRRIGRLALADALGTTPYWARQALAHYDDTHHASTPVAGDTSTEVTSA